MLPVSSWLGETAAQGRDVLTTNRSRPSQFVTEFNFRGFSNCCSFCLLAGLIFRHGSVLSLCRYPVVHVKKHYLKQVSRASCILSQELVSVKQTTSSTGRWRGVLLMFGATSVKRWSDPGQKKKTLY